VAAVVAENEPVWVAGLRLNCGVCAVACCGVWRHACRYHYNVANTRVDQHVEKGNDDGLYISSVACCQVRVSGWVSEQSAGRGVW
jgi:hypothetical protein